MERAGQIPDVGEAPIRGVERVDPARRRVPRRQTTEQDQLIAVPGKHHGAADGCREMPREEPGLGGRDDRLFEMWCCPVDVHSSRTVVCGRWRGQIEPQDDANGRNHENSSTTTRVRFTRGDVPDRDLAS